MDTMLTIKLAEVGIPTPVKHRFINCRFRRFGTVSWIFKCFLYVLVFHGLPNYFICNASKKIGTVMCFGEVGLLTPVKHRYSVSIVFVVLSHRIAFFNQFFIFWRAEKCCPLSRHHDTAVALTIWNIGFFSLCTLQEVVFLPPLPIHDPRINSCFLSVFHIFTSWKVLPS